MKSEYAIYNIYVSKFLIIIIYNLINLETKINGNYAKILNLFLQLLL